MAHTSPVADQIIHSCVNGNSGEIKIVDPLADAGSKDKGSKDKGSKDADGCKKNESALDWNAIGPQGEQGEKGDQETADRPYANITLLVPKSSFYELLERIKDIASVVKNENVNSNDVTEEYIDVAAKLDVMKETESRFLSLLSDTDNIEEIIQLEKELMRLRGEIDSLEGRVSYLTKTTDNSFLYLHMMEETSITGSKWDPRNSFSDSIRNLISFSKHAADFLISLVVFLPFVLVLVVVLGLGYKGLKRFRARLTN